MNPNQPHNFQPYSNQLKPPQYNNFQYPNQPQFNQNTLNLPRNNFHQGGSLSPTQAHNINRNKLDRAMYSSTIEGTLPSKSFGLGKLQSMGRFIGGNDDFRNETNKPTYEFHTQAGQYGGQFFRQKRQKTSEPHVIPNKQTDFDRFPSFNINENHGHQSNFNTNNYSIRTSQPQQNYTNQAETLTPEQKRRREILAIKKQLEMINKKMQSSNLSKKFTQQSDNNDIKLSVNNNHTISQNSNNYLSPTNNTSSGLSIGSSYGSSNLDTGLSFTRNNNNQLNVGERNKGLVTQSMIVSNEPSTGFKYQSIFEKYDSMKKPTFQTQNTETKQERPSLLDKFVHKGPGSTLNQQKKPQTYGFKQAINPLSPQTSTTTQYDFQSSSKQYQQSSNFTPNYVTSSNNSNNSNIGSAMTFGNISSQHPPESGSMFKKKKVIEQLKTEVISPIQQKTSENQPTMMFKKSPRNVYEENFVTKAMKQMKIEESVDFKRDDFIVGKKLGKGQFGEVMLVQHKKTGFLCGMKVMEKKQIRDEKYEGQIARQLSVQFYLAHRNIAPLYGYFQDEKNVYLLVEYCTGGQLLELLRKNRRMEQPQVSRIIKQIIEGIDYIHKELIIHRDIKPENILFNFGVAKICDFGWAVYKGHGMRKTASVGSPLYYSPEIVMGVQYDQKIDIWDIGMMTYECLLGKIPFRIYSQLDLNRIVQDEIKFPEYIDTSDEAKDFILRIMKKKPEERMQIREMLRHPFITKYQDQKLPIEIMKDFKEVLS